MPRPPQLKLTSARAPSSHALNASLHATSFPTRTHPRDPPPPHQLHPPRHRSPACSPQLARGPMILLHCPRTPWLPCPCARHYRRHHVVPVPNFPPPPRATAARLLTGLSTWILVRVECEPRPLRGSSPHLAQHKPGLRPPDRAACTTTWRRGGSIFI